MQPLKVMEVKMRVFWNIASCIIVGVDRRFRVAYYLHHQGDETLVYSETARRPIPEGCHLHTRSRENLKSHMMKRKLFSDIFSISYTPRLRVIESNYISNMTSRSLDDRNKLSGHADMIGEYLSQRYFEFLS
jgi:hypothetical protein